MVKLLVVASMVWPLMMAGAVWERAATGGSVWTAALYAAASRICHQRPERSFHTAGVKWPVCGRCSGLYLGAPLGALAAIVVTRRKRAALRTAFRANGTVQYAVAVFRAVWLAVAGLPTLLTLVLEWSGLVPVSTLARFVAAVPLGAVIAYALVTVVSWPPRPIEYTGAE